MALNPLGNVLESPQEVFLCVQSRFPLATAEVQPEDHQCTKMTIWITGDHALSITTALDRNAFVREITKISHRMLVYPLKDPLIHFDADACCLNVPLLGWKSFRRAMYERGGKTCSDLIIRYLKEGGAQLKNELAFLGLDPEQVNDPHAKKELDHPCFEKTFSIILEKNEPERKELLSRCGELYPEQLESFLNALAQAEHQKSLVGVNNKCEMLLKSLRESVIGQDLATQRMAALLTAQSEQPLNRCFLFVGPTGVGKTELAKALSKEKGDRFVMFAMNQFQNESDVSKLFGSSSGVVGSTDLPHFAKALDRYCSQSKQQHREQETVDVKDVVILFDELEKSPSSVRQSLLTLFDEGYCDISYSYRRSHHEDHSNVTIRYRLINCIIVCTSNLCQQVILNAFNQGLENQKIIEAFVQSNGQLPPYSRIEGFSPELLGRLTIIPFGPIAKGECFQKIIKLKLIRFMGDLKNRLSCPNIVMPPEHEFGILASLENRLYKDGTDIRRVDERLDEIRDLISSQKHLWGHLNNKRIVLSYDPEQGPCLRIFVHLHQIGMYREIPNLPPLPF